MARFFLLVIFLFSFEFNADETDGLPELATESEKRKLQNKDMKINCNESRKNLGQNRINSC